jgi:hypothetical protein
MASTTQAELKITDPNIIEVTEGNSDNLLIQHKDLNDNIPWIDVVPYYLALYALNDPDKEGDLDASLQSCDETINFDKFVQHFINENDAYAYFKVLQISLFFAPLLLENQRNINFKIFLTFYVKKICNLFLLFKNLNNTNNTLINEIVELIQNDNPILFIKNAKEDSQIIDYLAKLANTFLSFDKNIMDVDEIKKIAKNIPNELPKNFILDENVKNMLIANDFDMFDPNNDIIMYKIYNRFYSHYKKTLVSLDIYEHLKYNITKTNQLLNCEKKYDMYDDGNKNIYEYLYNLRRHECKELIDTASNLFTKSVELIQEEETITSQKDVIIKLESNITKATEYLVNANTSVKNIKIAVIQAKTKLDEAIKIFSNIDEKNIQGKQSAQIYLDEAIKESENSNFNLEQAEKDEQNLKEIVEQLKEKLLENANKLIKQENVTSSPLLTAVKIALGAATAAIATAGVVYAAGAGPTVLNAFTGAASSLKSALTGSPVSSGIRGAANVANAGVYTRDLGTKGAANVGNVSGFKGTKSLDTSTTTVKTADGGIVNVNVNCNVNKELLKAKLKNKQLKERLREMDYNYEELMGKSEQCFGKQDEYSQKKATAAMAAKIRRASLSKERQKLKKRNLSPKDCIEELARARARLRNLGKRP